MLIREIIEQFPVNQRTKTYNRFRNLSSRPRTTWKDYQGDLLDMSIESIEYKTVYTLYYEHGFGRGTIDTFLELAKKNGIKVEPSPEKNVYSGRCFGAILAIMPKQSRTRVQHAIFNWAERQEKHDSYLALKREVLSSNWEDLNLSVSDLLKCRNLGINTVGHFVTAARKLGINLPEVVQVHRHYPRPGTRRRTNGATWAVCALCKKNIRKLGWASAGDMP